jgi:hypothetical protein
MRLHIPVFAEKSEDKRFWSISEHSVLWEVTPTRYFLRKNHYISVIPNSEFRTCWWNSSVSILRVKFKSEIKRSPTSLLRMKASYKKGSDYSPFRFLPQYLFRKTGKNHDNTDQNTLLTPDYDDEISFFFFLCWKVWIVAARVAHVSLVPRTHGSEPATLGTLRCSHSVHSILPNLNIPYIQNTDISWNIFYVLIFVIKFRSKQRFRDSYLKLILQLSRLVKLYRRFVRSWCLQTIGRYTPVDEP